MKQSIRALIRGLLLTSVAVRPVCAQGTAPAPRPTVKAARLAAAPRLDGNVLDDPSWKVVAPLISFWQTAPDAGQPASERTEVRIAFTADTIYVGVVCFDRDPGGLIVSDARRDSLMSDTDGFRIIFDTYHDGQNGFVFGTTPAGIEYDGQVTQEGVATQPGGGGTGPATNTGGRQQAGSGGGFNLNWDGSWQVRAVRSDIGWSAEFAIPLRTLRYASGTDRTWGLNFERTIKRRKETAFWAPLPIQFDLYRVSMAGTLTGLDIPTQRSLKFVPYVLGRTEKVGTRGLDAESLADIGGDAKYSLTPSLTLDEFESNCFREANDTNVCWGIAPSNAQILSDVLTIALLTRKSRRPYSPTVLFHQRFDFARSCDVGLNKCGTRSYVMQQSNSLFAGRHVSVRNDNLGACIFEGKRGRPGYARSATCHDRYPAFNHLFHNVPF